MLASGRRDDADHLHTVAAAGTQARSGVLWLFADADWQGLGLSRRRWTREVFAGGPGAPACHERLVGGSARLPGGAC